MSRIPPVEIADTVELFARKSGRHGTIRFVEPMGVWVIRLSYNPSSVPMKLYKEGKLKEEPFETVYLTKWDDTKKMNVPVDLDDYGADGIKELLEKADLWSGTGEYPDMMTAARAAIEKNERVRENMKQHFKEVARDAAEMGHALATPSSPVIIDLNS